MSARPSAFVERLRRELRQRPDLTPLPVCSACGREVQPRDFGKEHCRPCEAERAAVSEQWEQERWEEANGGPVAQHPAMFGDPAADRPFLPDDENLQGMPAADGDDYLGRQHAMIRWNMEVVRQRAAKAENGRPS